MKLFDATLDLASFAKGTEDYVISAVDTEANQIICNDLSGRIAEFGGGTIWFRGGDSALQFGRIKSSAAQTIDLLDTFPDGYAAGDLITIGAWLEFDTQKLINAVNSVLRLYKVLRFNSELSFDRETSVYDLPDGVSGDVRKVYLPLIDHEVLSHYWRVEDGKLYLYDNRRFRYLDGGTIRIAYADYHGEVGKGDTISDQVDRRYLRYMAWLYLCRNLIQTTHKDNLIATDMYNEAKVYERDYGELPNKQLPPRTLTFPSW